MTIRHPLFAAALVAALAASTPATAKNTGACKPFTVVSDGSDRTVKFVDVGGDGPGPGDKRIGRRGLADQAGKPVGYYRWVITVLNQPGEDGKPGESFEDNVIVLDDGYVGFRRVLKTANPAQEAGKVSWAAAQPGFITGGTGAYAGAEGTVILSVEDKKVTMEFDIDCDS